MPLERLPAVSVLDSLKRSIQWVFAELERLLCCVQRCAVGTPETVRYADVLSILREPEDSMVLSVHCTGDRLPADSEPGVRRLVDRPPTPYPK